MIRLSRQTIILLGIGLLVVISVLLWFALQPRLTLKSGVEGLSTIEVNGQKTDFKDGMTIPFASTVTIKAEKDGYYPITWTLDPSQQKITEFTINLERQPTGTDTSENAQIINNLPGVTPSAPNELADILLQAAVQSGESSLLNFGTALGVDIVDSRVFEGGNYIGYIVAPKPPMVTDPAMVIVQRVSSGYAVIIGPGTNFDIASTANLPLSVANYIREKGFASE